MFVKFHRSRRGFTLIEMLIVIVVIAVLASIIVPKLIGGGKKAKEAKLNATAQTIQKANNLYEADNGAYAADWATLKAAKRPKEVDPDTPAYLGAAEVAAIDATFDVTLNADGSATLTYK